MEEVVGSIPTRSTSFPTLRSHNSITFFVNGVCRSENNPPVDRRCIQSVCEVT
jgi:hypothetical protein